jgi:hypothetical protein
MTEQKYTTLQMDKDTRDLLRHLAEEDFRSLPAEIRWLINQEMERRMAAVASEINCEEE